MTTRPGLEREVRSWLREDGREDAERVLFTVLDQLDTTPQRHAGWLARRFPIMNSKPARYGIAAAVVAAAALLGANLLPESTGDHDPTPSPTSARPLTGTTSLAPGTYVIEAGYPVRIWFSVPSDGWHNYVWESGAAGSNTRALCTNASCDSPGAGIGFHIVTGVPANACNPGEGRMDVGPSIEDLADAIRNRAGWTTTEPVATTISGFPAVSFEIRPQPDEVGSCTDGVGAFYSGPLGRSATSGERLRIWIVDVAGTRLLVEAFDFGTTPDEEVGEATRIVESVVLQPLTEAGAGGGADQPQPGKVGKRRSGAPTDTGS